MPTIEIEGYAFRFYSSDGGEPPHVHIIKDGRVAKVWLSPIELEYNKGYRSHELNKIIKLTRANREILLEAWNVYFG
jgi:hypothetical protein